MNLVDGWLLVQFWCSGGEKTCTLCVARHQIEFLMMKSRIRFILDLNLKKIIIEYKKEFSLPVFVNKDANAIILIECFRGA